MFIVLFRLPKRSYVYMIIIDIAQFYLLERALFAGNKHLDNMANCPAKAAYGFMDLDTRTAK